MITKLIFVVVTTIAIGIGYHQYLGGNLIIFGEYCHRRFNYPFKYMSTKTPYLSEDLEKHAELGDPFQDFHGSECDATMTWHLIRHGTRNPGAKIIKTMKTLLPVLRKNILDGHQNGKGSLCPAELKELEEWHISDQFPLESHQKILVPQGQKELIGISKRFKMMFPNVYASQYHNDTFKFKYTKTQRAEASAIHYSKGIFNESQIDDIYFPTAVVGDPVIRFYKECQRWKKEVDKNPEAYKERVKFETSALYTEMMKKLQERLGLKEPPTLADVEIMYLACSFESAWNPSQPSPWCHVFDEFDFHLLEYRQDIEYYWIDGYGYKLTYEQACSTMGDILEKLSSKIKDPSSPSVVAYFTHSGTLLKVFTRLGLFNDSVPLLGSNFEHHRYSRKWRTSVIDPFATNLAFVLYRCSQSYKVGLLFKEKPIAQPLCDGKYLCPFDEFQTSMERFSKNCDLKRLCQLS